MLTAKNWARAAIVYAFTYEGTNQHDGNPSGSLSISGFAKLSIVGLSQREDVGYYRSARSAPTAHR